MKPHSVRVLQGDWTMACLSRDQLMYQNHLGDGHWSMLCPSPDRPLRSVHHPQWLPVSCCRKSRLLRIMLVAGLTWPCLPRLSGTSPSFPHPAWHCCLSLMCPAYPQQLLWPISLSHDLIFFIPLLERNKDSKNLC